MRIELPRPVFKAAIERLSVLNESGKVKVDAYTHVRLQGEPGRLTLSTFNRTMKAELSITDPRIPDSFVCGLPLQQLREFVSTLPEADHVRLEFEQTGCTVFCGNVKFRTKLLIEDAFPREADLGEEEFLQVNLQLLFGAMDAVKHCVDTASARQYAHGILLLPGGPGAAGAFCTTNGMRMALSPNPWISVPEAVAIPAETFTRLQKLFKGYQEGGVLVKAGEFVITAGGIRSTFRLASWPIPKIKGVIPKGQASVVLVPKEALKQALQRAVIIANEMAPQTELHFAGDGMIRVLTEEDGQMAEDTVQLHEGVVRPPKSMRVNPSYMLDAIESIEDPLVRMEVRSPTEPLILTNEAGDHLNVIMPFKSDA